MDKDDDERTKTKDTSQLRIEVHKTPQTIDEIFENIEGSVGMEWFKYIKYDTLDTKHKDKIEEVVLDMMGTLKYIPFKLGNLIEN